MFLYAVAFKISVYWSFIFQHDNAPVGKVISIKIVKVGVEESNGLNILMMTTDLTKEQ